MEQSGQEICPKSRANPTMDIQLQLCLRQHFMSCHHSGPSTQWTGLLLRVSPTEDKCTITIDTPTPLCPSLPGKKDKAFRICSSETWSSCAGVSPPVFPTTQCKSSRKTAFCASTAGQRATELPSESAGNLCFAVAYTVPPL